MLIEIPCQKCGRPYAPSREDVLRGPHVYRLCPACRSAIRRAGTAKPLEHAPREPSGKAR
jgi:hypothetical protein